MPEPTLRPYEPGDDADRRALWSLKTAFETDLGTGTGGDEKAARYDAKLTDDYRRRWLAWVDRCVADDARCVTLADPGDEDGGAPVGYAFVLPERLAFVRDAAVVNELYVAPAHRGTGVADALLASAVELAREQDPRSSGSCSTSIPKTSAPPPSTSGTASSRGVRSSPGSCEVVGRPAVPSSTVTAVTPQPTDVPVGGSRLL